MIQWPETPAEREHRLDREVIRAVYRREQAQAGKGYVFKIPPGASIAGNNPRPGADR